MAMALAMRACGSTQASTDERGKPPASADWGPLRAAYPAAPGASGPADRGPGGHPAAHRSAQHHLANPLPLPGSGRARRGRVGVRHRARRPLAGGARRPMYAWSQVRGWLAPG